MSEQKAKIEPEKEVRVCEGSNTGCNPKENGCKVHGAPQEVVVVERVGEPAKKDYKVGDTMVIEVPQQPIVVKKEEQRGVGRPTVMTDEVIAKLEAGFMYAYTDQEACLYAGISHDTLWRYQKDNPDFAKRKEELRLTPNLQAKKVLVEDIKDNPAGARYWAERRMRNEFQPSAKVEHSGNVVMTGDATEIDKDEEELARKYEEDLDKLLARRNDAPVAVEVEALPEGDNNKKDDE